MEVGIKKNEKHRLFIVLGIVVAVVLFIVGVTIVGAKDKLKIFDEFNEVLMEMKTL